MTSIARRFRARVVVVPRREILDPQGKAIRGALARSGFPGVEEVRAGKSFDVLVASPDAAAARRLVEAMAEQVLHNPIVEDFEILEVTALDDGEGAGGGA